MNDQSTLLTLEYEQRLDNYWSVEVESRWFQNSDKTNILSIFQQDNHVLFNVIRYF